MGKQTPDSRKVTNARYYLRTKDEQNKKRQAWMRKFRAWALSLKEGPCVDCGGEFHPVAMNWHHRDPLTKTADVGALVGKGNKAVLLAEIAKCDLICANCHALRTWT